MVSSAERMGRRLLALKQLQQQLAAAAAHRHAQAAQAKREQARALHEAARRTVADALLQSEQELSRSALFERLRLLAVARAYAMEAEQAAQVLEREAAGCEAAGDASRRSAARHRRKHGTLRHWQMRLHAGQVRRDLLRDHLEQLEDVACRCRSRG